MNIKRIALAPCYRTPNQAKTMFKQRVKKLRALIGELKQFGGEAHAAVSPFVWRILNAQERVLNEVAEEL